MTRKLAGQSHIDADLYGEQDDSKRRAAMEAAKRDFNEMVHSALSGSKVQGDAFLKYLDGYLKTPTWFPNEPENVIFYREGARDFVRNLIDAYNAGGVPADLKKK